MIKKILFLILFIGLYSTAFAQAPGNSCAAATPLTLAPGSTMSTGYHEITGANGYTSIYGNNTSPCGSVDSNGTANNTPPAFYGGGRDGVYSIDVVIPGDYIFALSNYNEIDGTGTTWNMLAVHSSCAIDNTSCEGSFHTGGARDDHMELTLTPGTYYILIDSFSSFTAEPRFELLITSPIANDDCSGAVELFSTIDCSFVTYTNEDATASAGAPAPTCANYQGGDVWFSYVVNDAGEFTVTTEAGVMTDSGMSIYSGTCGSLTQLGCNDNFSGSGLMSSLTITGRTPGEIVYIRIWEYGNNNNGTFNICVTTPLLPGDNGVYEDCPNERSKELTSDFICPPGVNISNVVFGNLLGGATAKRLNTSVVNTTVCGFSGFYDTRYEEIEFTVPTTGLYELEMTSASFDGMGYIVESGFTPGVCGGTFVVGDDDSGAGVLSELSVNLTAGVNYTLITTEWGFGAGSGNSPYTWTVTTGPDINWLTTIAIDWYAVATGGTSIKTGPSLNPVNFPGSGLTDTSTPGVYSYWYECSSNPGVRTKVDYVIGKVWDGSTSSDWNTASNWADDQLPTDSQCIYIQAGTPNDPVIPDDVNGDGQNLTIETGATLTLASDGNANNFASSLTIQDHINIQGTGSLIVQNDASLIQVNDAPAIANSGAITLNRNADIRQLDYVYWSSPVGNYDVSDVYDVNTPTDRIYEWVPTIATPYTGPPPGFVPVIAGTWVSGSGTMSLGKGYAVRGPTNHTTTKSIATATFTGVPNNGVITQAISSGNYSGALFTYNPYANDQLNVTSLDDNWNLIGNPYPSALDANSFLTHPSNALIEGAVHIWTHGTAIGTANGDSFYDDFYFTYSDSDYITYNLSGPTYPDESFAGKIASGQGFFVLALNDSETGNVTFNNSMRDRTHSNTAFYRTADSNEVALDVNAIERHRIWLNLVDQNGSASSIMVGYIEGATQEKDRLYDAYSREVNDFSMYSKINDERMSIQGRALPFDDHDQVPLGTFIPQAGDYTIAISGVDGLFLDADQNIYLEDTHTGVIHNLRAAPYTFTATEAIDYEDRFLLRYTDDALSINDEALSTLKIVAPKGEYIKVSSKQSLIEAVTVYDLLGRTLLTKTNLETLEFIVNNHNLSSGTYIVQVTLSSGATKTQKVILKQ